MKRVKRRALLSIIIPKTEPRPLERASKSLKLLLFRFLNLGRLMTPSVATDTGKMGFLVHFNSGFPAKELSRDCIGWYL